MNVEIREKPLKNGKVSLYLDIYNEGKRSYQFLKLYPLENPKTKEERATKSEIMRKANAARIQAESDIVNEKEIGLGLKKSKMLFLDYFKEVTEQKRKDKSNGNYGTWSSTYKILTQYFDGKKVKIADLTIEDLNAIRKYIQYTYKTKSDTKLSTNAALAYFNKVKASLNQAFDERIISQKIGKDAKALKGADTMRGYLTEEEVAAIEKAYCESQILKNAFLFSVFTGLRWSDINNLTWKNLQFTSGRYSIDFQQQKSEGIQYHPIANKAITFIGERQGDNERIFKGLKYSAWHNIKIREWMINAGVKKKITFHSARHTYATLLLTKDVDMTVVSKMLGHKNLKTTQIYAKVIDQRKIDAANVLDLL
jgi:integrase